VRYVDALPAELRPVVNARRPWLGTFSAAVHADLFPMHQSLRSVALIPLVRQEHVSGLVNFGSNDSRRFTRTHATDFLAHLGIIAAVCMENAINRSRVLRSGLSDFLTGWHNRRYLETRLKEELARAHRHSLSVACLLIDVDRFKQVNDTHGHLAGDRMLREIARRIETHIRASDTAARFGGDEFAILLAETGRAEAVKLAERIRLTVNAEPVVLGNGAQIVPSLSIGVAAVDPAHDKRDLKAMAEALLAEADAHLYRAKAQGRNRVAAS
jgi:diguanylate cyclase (GGDEF)-like protein